MNKTSMELAGDIRKLFPLTHQSADTDDILLKAIAALIDAKVGPLVEFLDEFKPLVPMVDIADRYPSLAESENVFKYVGDMVYGKQSKFNKALEAADG